MITLSAEQISNLRALDSDIKAVKAVLVKAERAGIDVSALKADLERIEKVRAGVLREFGPKRELSESPY